MLRNRGGERGALVGPAGHAGKLAIRGQVFWTAVVAHAITPEPDPPSGRRYRGLSAEERRADQRRRLVRAAIEEFAARGYHRTSVEDIVRSARTSRTAFYSFFDNREDAMYGALQTSLRRLLDTVRDELVHADPQRNITEVGISAYVNWLVADPPAARIILLEGVGTSPEVNALRSRIRREIADLIRDLWAEYDPEMARSPHASAISVGVFGILFESMVHLAETNRLLDAPSHVPALVTAVNRVLTPSPPA
jgi:AcrR family transcriptional regulator